ncbi:hypothetical protein CEB3_c22710 [Peptococcaceae bacterium CEB3]|nr:hypothetical protein CEB3_c22710 [Peptococcaceae bacterium CEB3]
MDDIVWFPVTDQSRERFERICSLTGQSKEEWFERALLDTESKFNLSINTSIPEWRRTSPPRLGLR